MCGARRLRGEMGCPPQHPKVSQVPQVRASAGARWAAVHKPPGSPEDGVPGELFAQERTSPPVALHTFATSLEWAFSTSSLVSVWSSERYVSANAMDFLPAPTRTGSR